MLLTETWVLDAFLAEHPPVDLLAAAWMGYKAPVRSGQKAPGIRQLAKSNSEALAKLPPRRKVATVSQMPAFLRTPGQLAMIEGMKLEWQTNSA